MQRSGLAFALAPVALALGLGAPGGAFAEATAAKVDRARPDKLVVSWTAAGPVDVYWSDRPDASAAQARLVSDNNRSGHVELSAAAGQRPYFLLKDETDGKLTRVAERALPLQQGSNFRDLGGYATADGRHVRWGRIFRSGATPLLTDADVAQIHALGLAEMVDLRSSEERTLAPSRIDGVRYTAVGYSMSQISGGGTTPPTSTPGIGEAYRRFPDMLKPQLQILFAELLEGDGPVAYNCSAGQDRTGFATAMVLSALGVPRETIYADYHLSTTYRHPEWEMPRFDAAQMAANPTAAFFGRYQSDPSFRTPRPLLTPDNKPLLAFAFEAIEQKYGSVEAYLQQELGVGPAEIAKLRAMYLE